MSTVEVRDGMGELLGKVRVGDTKLQALERLGRVGAGGLYDRQNVGLLDAELLSAEGGPYVFKSSSKQPHQPHYNIQERSGHIYDQWSRRLETVPSPEALGEIVTKALPAFLPSRVTLTAGHDFPAVDVVKTVMDEDYSVTLAPELEYIRSAILALVFHGTTEDCTHTAVETLILNTITMLCQFRGCHIQRNRNGVDSSGATLANLRPDVLVWLPSGVLAFKGEDKAFGVDIVEARKDLTEKMALFSDAFFGEIPYQLAYACAGSKLEYWALVRTRDPRRSQPLQLTPQIDLATINGRSLCVRYAVNIARVLVSLHEKYPRGNAVRLGSTIKTSTSSVFIEGTKVIKKTSRYTGPQVVELYKRIISNQGVTNLINPVEIPRIGRGGELTVKLEPVGFCPDSPPSIQQAKSAGLSILKAIRWLHDNGFVHRDIRPSNILRSDGRWILTDLEWASFANQPLADYNPRLLPPECEGIDQTWSEASDMWQFGKLLELWGKLDEQGNALVRNLTSDDPNDRLSAEDCMRHEFFSFLPSGAISPV